MTFTPTAGSGCGTSSLSLQLKEFGTCGSNQNQQTFEVINSGTSPVTLSDITIKFWADDTTGGQAMVGAVNYGGCFGQNCAAVNGVSIASLQFSPACGPDSTHQANWEITVSNTDTRASLSRLLYRRDEPGNALAALQNALEMAPLAETLERRLRVDGLKTGRVQALDPARQIEQALALGILTEPEALFLAEYDRKVMAILNVDDFAPHELGVAAS